MTASWKSVLLQDVAEEVTVGHVGPMTAEYVPVGVPFLRSLNVRRHRIDRTDLKFVSHEFHRRLKKSRLNPGDVVVVRTGEPGVAAVIPEDLPEANCADLVIIRPSNAIDARFLSYYVNGAAQQHIAGHLVGAVQQHFNIGSAKKLPITLPPLSEQRVIASALGLLDEKIYLDQKMNQTLEAMTQSLFKSWFLDFDPVLAKRDGRQPVEMDVETAMLFPAHFQESTLGPIPQGWNPEALTDLASFTKGRSYKSSELIGSDTALVSLKSFQRGGGYREDGLKSYAGTYSPEQIIRPGEIIVACTDVTQDAEVVGRSSRVLPTQLYRTLVASLDVLIARPIKATVPISYLAALLRADDYVQHILGYVNGTTVLHLDVAGLSKYKVAVPNASLLQRFDAIVGPMYERSKANALEVRSLVTLRDLLLPQLLSGDIRLTDAERIVEAAVVA